MTRAEASDAICDFYFVALERIQRRGRLGFVGEALADVEEAFRLARAVEDAERDTADAAYLAEQNPEPVDLLGAALGMAGNPTLHRIQ